MMSVATNLLFFTKGEPTQAFASLQRKDAYEKCKAFLAYWEHKLPEGQKSYSKTKPIQKTEFTSLKAWWNKRTKNDADMAGQAWRVPIEQIAANGWNLDVKNPFVREEEKTHTTAELIALLHESFAKSDALLRVLR